MAGTIPLSMTQQFDVYGKPLAGGQLYIIQAGTVSTPQNAFQDVNLAIPLPNPITLDAAGRVPQFFLADGYIKIRLQDKSGVVQLAADMILVIGPSAGGGGGSGSVDPTALIQTGNMILRYGVGPLTGYVRLNNLTIGSSTSGATERANADTQALFLYLWGVDPNLVVSTGRGATALADWTANKQLTLPDWRGYAFGALDDMGNSASGRLSAAYFGLIRPINDPNSPLSPVQLGGVGGGESLALAAAQLPIIRPAGTITNGVITATPTYNGVGSSGLRIGATPDLSINATGGNTPVLDNGGTLGIQVSQAASSFLGAQFGGGLAHRTIGPRKLCTAYIKL